MTTVKQKAKESRKDYLVRVAIIMLKENGYNIDTIEFDGADCDAFCLADDLKAEFNIETEDW